MFYVVCGIYLGMKLCLVLETYPAHALIPRIKLNNTTRLASKYILYSKCQITLIYLYILPYMWDKTKLYSVKEICIQPTYNSEIYGITTSYGWKFWKLKKKSVKTDDKNINNSATQRIQICLSSWNHAKFHLILWFYKLHWINKVKT